MAVEIAWKCLNYILNQVCENPVTLRGAHHDRYYQLGVASVVEVNALAWMPWMRSNLKCLLQGLLRLPNEMVQRVLSFLPATSLVDTSRVCRRLGSLTASRHLWRHGDAAVDCADLPRLVEVVGAAPPWDTLAVAVDAGPCIRACFQEDARKLSVRVPDLRVAAALLGGELGRRPTLLHFRELVQLEEDDVVGADAVWASLAGLTGLPDAAVVESLFLELQAEGPVARSSFRWPKSKTLPAVHTIKLQLVEAGSSAEAACDVLESLLRAHSAQVRCVDLLSPSLVPLLDLCSAALRRVSALATPCLAQRLKRLGGLEELRLEGVQTAALPELVGLLGSSRTLSGLRSLSIRSAVPCVEVVRALGANGGRLTLLTHLKLAVPVASMGALDEALAGLPRLHSLTLRHAPASVDLDAIPLAAVPALAVLTVLAAPCVAVTRAPEDSLGRTRWTTGARGQSSPGPVCRHGSLCRLVQRSPAGLHVVCRTCPSYLSSLRAASAAPSAIPEAATLLLAAHPDTAYAVPCPQCAEAREACKGMHFLATSRRPAHADAHLQYVCVRRKAS